MDIWKWVNDIHASLIDIGEDRLAYLLNEIPNQVCRNNHEHVDALIPEALALSISCWAAAVNPCFSGISLGTGLLTC